MSDPVRRQAGYEDLLTLPDDVVGEIVGGELFTSPRPASRPTRAASVLGGRLIPPFDFGEGGPGGWWILLEPELHLGAHVLVPDLAGWRRERMPLFPDGPFFTVAPDWVCEVVSPATGRLDRIRKMPAYAECAVQFAWLIDPILRTLELFQLENTRWAVVAGYEGDQTVRAVPFEAVAFDLGSLWI